MVNARAIHTGPSLGEFLLIEEVAELTRLPLSTLRFYRHRGDGGPKSFKLGNRVAYKRADVEQWIEEQYRDSTVQHAG
jgi:predicted DNA-binding transcriptional regulator AlpA